MVTSGTAWMVTVSCIVMTHSGSTNDSTAVASSTTRFTRWKVSFESNRR